MAGCERKMDTIVNETENWMVIGHNGKIIHIEFVDCQQGDANILRVTIQNKDGDVVICDENIQQ
jgi:hypothetical protein